jgi:hypothetical protein
VLLADLAIALLPGGQRRKGAPEMTLCIAVKAALTAEALPLSAYGQGHHLAPAQGSLWSRVWLRGQRGLAKVVYHNVTLQRHLHGSVRRYYGVIIPAPAT